MPRIARVIAPGIPHHITQRGNRRMQTFFSNEDYSTYIDLMAQWCRKLRVEIWAYCLMPNHIHMIAVPESEDGLRRAIGEAHRRYTRRINFREGWRGHLWQGRFASFPMDETYVLATARYIELNPVRARLVRNPFSYPWSSAAAHAKGENDGLVRVEPLLGMAANWCQFLADGIEDEKLLLVRRHERTGRLLGSDGFIENLEELLEKSLKIICVTRENVNSPWVLFEAGALAKTMQGSKVIPLLLDLEIRDITGPLAQFQAKKVEKAGVNEVINSINQTANNVVPEARARELFEALWPKLDKEVKTIPKQPASEKHARPQHEILEELVVGVRSLDSRLRKFTEGGPFVSRRRRLRFHPMMFMEMMHMGKRSPGDPVGLLMLASVLREDMPWLYEPAMEVYRTTKAGLPDEAARARRDFRRTMEFCVRGPLMEEMDLDPEIRHMLMRELEHSVLPEPPSEEEPKEKHKRKKDEKESA